MRKHFLLLFLMALLPLAGWAQLVDLTEGWSIQLTPSYATYTGANQTPTVTLVHATDPSSPLTTGFNVEWADAERKNVAVNGYAVTVTADMSHTVGELAKKTVKYYITKATTNAISTAPEKANNTTYAAMVEGGGTYTLVKTEGTATFGDVEYIVSAETPAANAKWSTDLPTTTQAGSYKVWYRVPETTNYNGIDITELGVVNVVGSEPTFATAPQAVEGTLTYNGNPQALITAGTVTTGHGTPKYRVNGGAWGEAVPTAIAAGDYTVEYMIEGAVGYENKVFASPIAKSIVVATPDITDPVGKTGLIYDGTEKSLLETAATETLNAPITYTVTRKAPGSDLFVAYLDGVASSGVKATNAGTYKIIAKVNGAANFSDANGEEVDVVIAGAAPFTSAPTAKSLTWTGAAQQLIEAGAGTVDGKVQYQLKTNGATTQDWTSDITLIKATDATKDGNVYTAYCKVIDPNYANYNEPLEIANVKINKAFLTIKVKDVTKTYDATTGIPAITTGVGGNINEKLQFITTAPGYVTTGVAYVAIPDGDENINKKVGTKKGVVTISKDAFITLDAVNANYDVSIVPGDLIVNEAELYVTANNQAALTTNMSAIGVYDLANQYIVSGLVGGETKADAFETAPVLTASDAPATIVPGQYTLAFTQGTLKAGGNYKMRAANPYVIADGEKFIVNPAAGTKVVITVLPHSKKYGAADPDYSKWVEGTDYFVSGLAAGDELQGLTFSRDEGETVAGGPYALKVSASVKNPGWYDEEIAFNNSTFTIETVELTATVNQQTVKKDEDDSALDQNAWTVTGLVGPDAEAADVKTLLGASLSFDAANTATTGLKVDAIELAITNTNYTLAAGSATGDLLVISTTQFALDPTDADLVSKLSVADGDDYEVVFTNKTTMNIGEWYAMVLPFDVDPLKMVSAFNRYVIFNELNTKGTTNKNFKFTLTMNTIPAGTPFLIKFAPKTGDAANQVVNWATDFTSATYGAVEISKDIKEVDATYVIFTGIYEQKTMQNQKNGPNTADIQDNVWWLANTNYKGDNEWKKPTNSVHTTAAMEAYLKATDLFDDATYAPIITVEDFDGQTTAIKSLSADEIHGLNVKGMYNLNGMKMNNVPTQKGVYIVNGKKVVIK